MSSAAPINRDTDPTEADRDGGNRDVIFQRIMRKLQHRANYSEATAVTLTQQVLGVPPPGVAPVVAKAKTEDESGASAATGGGAAKFVLGSTKKDGGAPDGGLIMIGRADLEHDDQEKKFGAQPCPPTLRLVIEYVHQSISERLQLAHIGSLYETMKYVFESRTMLDKLLKEVAQHAHFEETRAAGGSTTSAPSNPSSPARVQELYQELRKVPVVIPQSHYVQDMRSGRYHPELRSVSEFGTSAPAVVGAASAKPGGAADATATGSIVTRGAGGLNAAPPPRGGGGAGRGRPSMMNAAFSSGAGAGGTGSGGGSAAASPLSAGGTAASSTTSTSLVQAYPSHFVQTAMTAKDKRDHELLMKHLRRRTQVEERSAQTDENQQNAIFKEQFLALGKHCANLEIELEQKKGAVRELAEQLQKIKTQLERKAKVVQYLRATLFRETCVLRQQLSAAAQKQQLLQQQYQIMSQQMMLQVQQSIGSNSSALSSSVSQTLAGTGNAAALASSSAVTQSVALPPSMTQPNSAEEMFDPAAVSSIIDLAMLGVEKNRSLNKPVSEMLKISAMNGGLLSSGAGGGAPNAGGGPDDLVLTPNTEATNAKLREELQMRTFKWKRELAALRAKFAIVVTEKNKQIKSIQLSSDMKNMRTVLVGQVSAVREEFATLRKQIRDIISTMRNALLGSLAEADYAVQSLAKAVDDNAAQQKTALAQRELVQAARELFLPMMSFDYAVGSHVWLAKYRPTDPLLHFLQTRYSSDVIQSVSEPLDQLQQIYAVLQRFVLRTFAVPQVAHPTVGPVLVRLILWLIADSSCTQDLLVQLRSCLQIELDLCRRLARFNFRIKVTTWKQHRIQETALRAMKEVGLDVHSGQGGPSQKIVNRLAMKAASTLALKAEAQRQRVANAKEVHRIWRESTLDPFRGRRPPKVREPLVTTIAIAPLSAPAPVVRRSTVATLGAGASGTAS